MYGQKKTRRDFQNETGLKGKNLTSHLRTLLAGGGYIKRLVFSDPVKGGKRVAVYQSISVNNTLNLE